MENGVPFGYNLRVILQILQILQISTNTTNQAQMSNVKYYKDCRFDYILFFLCQKSNTLSLSSYS
jgi:hypothetical protein